MAGQHGVAPPALRRLRARSTAVSQPSLFDAAIEQGAPTGGSAPGPAEVEARRDRDPGRGDEEAGARTGRREDGGREDGGREDAGREDAGGEAEAPGRRAAG